MSKIPVDEITFKPGSIFDDCGRLFYWKDNIYRAITDQYAGFYQDLLGDRTTIRYLFEKGLIETEITDLSLDGYGLILKHKRIQNVSYCMEWTGEMLRDAALMICDLSIEMFKQGLVLKDAHPWNILFDCSKPVFVDFGSIKPLTPSSKWPYKEFEDRILLPLYLMSRHKHRIVRHLMYDTQTTLQPNDVYRLLLNRKSLFKVYNIAVKHKRYSKIGKKITQEFLKKLRKEVASLKIGCPKTEWSDYKGPCNRIIENQIDACSPKVRNVQFLLDKFKPKSVLDIGCNEGWFSKMAAKSGARVIATDIDETNLSKLYNSIKGTNIEILPLFMDICASTKIHGLFNAYPSAEKRLKSEMVMCLAVTHHLVFKRGASFNDIAKQLALFTEKWLIVEFVPPDDKYVNKWMSNKYNWYHLDGFRESLQQYFHKIEIFDSTRQPRVLLWCEK